MSSSKDVGRLMPHTRSSNMAEPKSGLGRPGGASGLGSAPSKAALHASEQQHSSTSHTVTLPPLKSGGGAGDLDQALGGGQDASGPIRRMRKKELVAYALGGGPGSSPAGALATLEAKEKQLALVRDNRQQVGRLLMEVWVDQVLAGADPGSAAASVMKAHGAPLQQGAAGMQGLARFGLSRGDLAAGGLDDDDIDRLYRAMYVYSVGFFDTMQDVIGYSPIRSQLLQSVWGGFLRVSEASLSVAFKSEFLSLATTSATAMNELLNAKEALAEARTDANTLAKDVAWLSAQHAEESALRRAQKREVEELRSALVREQAAREHAINAYTQEFEDRSRMQLDWEAMSEQLAEAHAQYAALDARFNAVKEENMQLRAQCKEVRNVFRKTDMALGMDERLSKQLDELTAHRAHRSGNSSRAAAAAAADAATATSSILQPEAAAQSADGQQQGSSSSSRSSSAGAVHTTAEPGAVTKAQGDASNACVTSSSRPATSNGSSGSRPSTSAAAPQGLGLLSDLEYDVAGFDMQPLAERLCAAVELMHGQWTDALEMRARAETEMFRLRAEWRSMADEKADAESRCALVAGSEAECRSELEAIREADATLNKEVVRMRTSMAENTIERQAAELERDRALRDVANAERRNQGLADVIVGLKREGEAQKVDAAKLVKRLEAAGTLLLHKRRVLGEVSKALAIAMQSLWAQQTARQHLAKQLAEERDRGKQRNAELQERGDTIIDINKQVQLLTAEGVRLKREVELLSNNLEATQKQVARLTQNLNEAEGRDEGHATELQDTWEKLEAANQKLRKEAKANKKALQDLTSAKIEMARLRQAAEAAERASSEAATAKHALEADLQRHNREREAGGMINATKQTHLELEQQRVATELSAAMRRQELLSIDLEVERTRTNALKDQLERKRAKKRKWKATSSDGDAEVARLQELLTKKQSQIEGLGQRMALLQTGAELMGMKSNQRLPRLPLEKLNSQNQSAGSHSSHEDSAYQQMDIAEANAELEAALASSTELGQSLLQCNRRLEEAQTSKQQALLALARPDLSEEGLASAQQRMQLAADYVRSLRDERSQIESERAAAAARARALQAALRVAHEQLMMQRQERIERSADQATQLLQATGLQQVQEAEEATLKLQTRLVDQLGLFDAFQQDKVTMGKHTDALQAQMDQMVELLKPMSDEKTRMEESLALAENTVQALQAELAILKREAQDAASNSQARIAELEAELAAAKEAASALEVRTTAAANMAEATYATERQKTAAAAALLETRVTALKARAGQLQEAFEGVVGECVALRRQMADASEGGGERWVYGYVSGVWKSATAVLGALASDRDPAALGCSRPSVVVPHASSMRGLVFAPEYLPVLCSQLLLEKIASNCLAAAAAASGTGRRYSMEAVAYDFFLSRLGSRVHTEAHLAALSAALLRQKEQSGRGRLVARLLGLSEGLPAAVAEGLVEFYAQLHAACGPLVGEVTESGGQVPCNVATRLAIELLATPFAAPAPAVVALPTTLTSLTTKPSSGNSTGNAGSNGRGSPMPPGSRLTSPTPGSNTINSSSGSSSGSSGSEGPYVAADAAVEAVLQALLAQREADAGAVEARFRAVDEKGRGLQSQQEFMALLQQLDATSAAQLSQETLNSLFRSALNHSGVDAGAISAQGFATAVLDGGFVGVRAHVVRHPAIAQRPPFNELKLLETTWRAVRLDLTAVIQALPKETLEQQAEQRTVMAEARQLDELLRAPDASRAAEAWGLLRRALAFHARHGTFL